MNLDQRSRIGDEGAARSGRAQGVSIAYKKRLANAFFESLDLVADGGLAHLEPFGRIGHAPVIEHRQERAEGFDVELQ